MFKLHLHDNEEVYAKYRKHKAVLLPRALESIFLIVVPWYIAFKYGLKFSDQIPVLLLLIWSLIGVLYWMRAYMVWSFNTYYVTSIRLVHIVHLDLFKKTVTETPLERILNVSYRTSGLLSYLFGFGDVLVQVVGIDQALVLKGVPHPLKVKDFIWDRHKEHTDVHPQNYSDPDSAGSNHHISFKP
jgi:hypothetical protein